MKNEEIKKLAELRNYIIGFYNTLEGTESPGAAVMKCTEVAYFCETLVNSADDLLKPYVSFQNQKD
tara:strand:+ start:1230 stop:1427 length:198 start_codon:yes stop_codon:yes gene_type:complete